MQTSTWIEKVVLRYYAIDGQQLESEYLVLGDIVAEKVEALRTTPIKELRSILVEEGALTIESKDGEEKIRVERPDLIARAFARRFCAVTVGQPSGGTLYLWDGVKFSDNISPLIRELKQLFKAHARRRWIEEILYLIKAEACTSEWPFNQPRRSIIPCRNGILDLETGKLYKHSPLYGLTYCIGAYYDPNAKSELWQKTVREIVTEKQERLFWQIVGYCLKPGNPYQLLFILVGDGANGKSTLLEALRALLGPENTAAIALHEIVYNRFAAAELAGKLANIYPDLPTTALKDTGVIKALTGGDRIKAERKFRDPFFFMNQAKLIFSANILPEVDDRSYAFWRRWVIINCPNKFEGDKADRSLLEKLKKPEELSGALNLALMGLRDLESNGFSITKDAYELREEWRRRSNSIYAFVYDELEPSSESWVSKDDLYARYLEFCKEEGFIAKPRNTFFTDLVKAFIEVHNSRLEEEQRRLGDKRTRILKGLKFKGVTGGTGVTDQTKLI
jgi:P4 family phage/plasmid primase-like protien